MNTTTTAQIENEPPRHPFDRAGLGKPPYRALGVSEHVYQACPGAPIQPGTSCDYCGQGIRWAVAVLSSDGKRFKVGCDCVAKVSKGAREYPSQRALDVVVRRHLLKTRHARENAKIAEGRAFLRRDDVRAKLSSMPHPTPRRAAAGETMLTQVEWFMSHAGVSGMLKTIKRVHEIVEAC